MSVPLSYELRFWSEFARLLTDVRFWAPARPPPAPPPAPAPATLPLPAGPISARPSC